MVVEKPHDARQENAEIKRTVLISHEQIQERVEKLAQEIHQDYQGKELVLVIVLKGAIIFASDLIKKLGKLGQDLTLNFVQISSYGQETESNREPKIVLDVNPEAIAGKDVLIVEDIVDTGYNLTFFYNSICVIINLIL